MKKNGKVVGKKALRTLRKALGKMEVAIGAVRAARPDEDALAKALVAKVADTFAAAALSEEVPYVANFYAALARSLWKEVE